MSWFDAHFHTCGGTTNSAAQWDDLGIPFPRIGCYYCQSSTVFDRHLTAGVYSAKTFETPTAPARAAAGVPQLNREQDGLEVAGCRKTHITPEVRNQPKSE